MNYAEAKKLSQKITVDEAQERLSLFDFETNLGNFIISEELTEIIWDLTSKTLEKESDLSQVYNFDTISYAYMACIEENDLEYLLDELFPTSKDKLIQNFNFDAVRQIVGLYNDLESDFEIQ